MQFSFHISILEAIIALEIKFEVIRFFILRITLIGIFASIVRFIFQFEILSSNCDSFLDIVLRLLNRMSRNFAQT